MPDGYKPLLYAPAHKIENETQMATKIDKT